MSQSRDEFRKKIFQNRKRDSRMNNFFDEELEIKQPSVKELMDFQDINDRESIVQILIKQAYVPGTNEKVFEDADKDTLMEMPAGSWIGELNNAIQDLSGLRSDDELKKSEETA